MLAALSNRASRNPELFPCPFYLPELIHKFPKKHACLHFNSWNKRAKFRRNRLLSQAETGQPTATTGDDASQIGSSLAEPIVFCTVTEKSKDRNNKWFPETILHTVFEGI